MIHLKDTEAVLAAPLIAVVGASDEASNFGRAVYRALRESGRDVVAVHPKATIVDGDPCYPDVASVPERPDAVVVMVGQAAAAGVVQECIDLGIDKVWLFKGAGGPGAVSDEALALCEQHGIQVVAGACPLMFVEPVGWFHKIHRAGRRAFGSVERRAS